MRLAGKTGIVVGGGGAIGRAIALKLAGEGAGVAIVDANQETADTVAQEILSDGGDAIACAVDITRFEAVREMTDAVAARFGGVDILVNSAGGSARKKMKPFKDQSIDVIDWMLGVNLHGPLYCIRAAVGLHDREELRQERQHRLDRRDGRLDEVRRVRGGQGWHHRGDAVAGDGARRVQHQRQLRLARPRAARRRDADDEPAFARRTSFLNRIAVPGDIADMALYLALPESDYITGQNYIVDGGRSLGLKNHAVTRRRARPGRSGELPCKLKSSSSSPRGEQSLRRSTSLRRRRAKC